MLSSAVLDKATKNLAIFAAQWQDEYPDRMHRRGLAEDGTPAQTGEFSSWVSRGTERLRDEDHPETKLRLTRAMRNLRKIAPREYDVMHRVLSGEPPVEIQKYLNDRAVRGGHPERYSLKDTVVLIVSGADKLAAWY